MNASADFPTPANPLSGPIVLTIRGLGHVPSFKNCKRSILDRHTGKQRTLTDGKTKRWMERCIQSFVSQLLSASQTTAGGTIPARSKLSSIALLLPADDSLQWIPRGSFDTAHVKKGEEGAEIIILAGEDALST